MSKLSDAQELVGFELEQIKEFIIKALQLESSDWFEYKKLAESMKEDKNG